MYRKGYTLIEVMIAVAIMAIVIAGSSRFFTNSVKSWSSNYAKLELQQNARNAMDEMTKSLLGASAATVVIDPAAVPANSMITYQVNKDAGVLSYAYYLGNGSLVRRFNNIESNIMPDVTSLVFEKKNETSLPLEEDLRCVKIQLVAEKKGQKVTLTSYTHLRNE